jgi:hypothetical protein
MKLFASSLVIAASLTLLSGYSCGQNGPTTPSVQLTWMQSTASGVTANCVYRGSASGTYTLPAIYCSTKPIITYTDTSVTRGTTYHYAITAQVGSTESAYSNDATAAVPLAPSAPVLGTPVETRLRKPMVGEKAPILTAKVIY